MTLTPPPARHPCSPQGGYAAALRAKQAVAAGDDAAAAAPLPRVAVLSSHSRLASHPIRSPLISSLSDRPLSSHKARPAKSQQTAATQRVGYRPATHSQRLVPLADATARAPAGPAASRATRQPRCVSCVAWRRVPCLWVPACLRPPPAVPPACGPVRPGRLPLAPAA